ncbi:MAG: ATP-dependent RecD-like DNA helicase [Chlamydiae bacterium]|nr:ATP-dependent RecD-like DNA helicase [Chlamydiota bacterium]
MTEPYHDQITGCVENIVFASEESGFKIANLKEPKKKELTSILGPLPTIQPGETLFCKGIWKHHPKYGKQFEVTSYEQSAPTDILGIQKYLESGLIKGIGPSYAKKIVDKFGINTLKVLDENPEKLSQIPGIGAKRLELIQKHWKEQHAIRHVMIFLQGHHISPNLAQKIYKLYGDESIQRVQENPYALAKKIFGVGFKTADTIAHHLGFEKSSPHRVDAGIEFLLWELSNEGHVCMPHAELLIQAKTLLEVEETLIEQRLEALSLEQQLIALEIDGILTHWVRPLYLKEISIAQQLDRLLSSKCSLREVDLSKAIDWVEEKMHLRLAEEQKHALLESLQRKIHIITGGPGTGKSTITKGILRITEKLTASILLAAPTGRAAKRLGEITHKKAFTIHSLLEFDYTNGGFKKGKDNPLSCDLLIIDEASMIDTYLMSALLQAIPSHARLILIGDVDQLPSVGPGNVLKDLIQSEKIFVTRLTQIFRQAANSKIITNAHRVNQGYFPDISNEPSSDFIFLESEEPEEIQAKILHLVQNELPQKYHFNPLQDIQILSPMKRGGVGIENLNHLLQKNLNPSTQALHKMGRSFHVGDKVIQLKNNYDKNVFNGDVGFIQDIDFEEELVTVDFDENSVLYNFSDLDELTLAYAISIHKYQGSECPCIIMPIHTSHFKLLYRNLLYTGITRGKKLVVLVGTKKALFLAVKNDTILKRFTGLKHFLCQTLPEITTL